MGGRLTYYKELVQVSVETENSEICNQQAGDPAEPIVWLQSENQQLETQEKPMMQFRTEGSMSQLSSQARRVLSYWSENQPFVLFRSSTHTQEDNLLYSVY